MGHSGPLPEVLSDVPVSPSVTTLLIRNFKFLTKGSLTRTRNYRFCEKEPCCLQRQFSERLPSMRRGWIPTGRDLEGFFSVPSPNPLSFVWRPPDQLAVFQGASEAPISESYGSSESGSRRTEKQATGRGPEGLR